MGDDDRPTWGAIERETAQVDGPMVGRAENYEVLAFIPAAIRTGAQVVDI